MQLPNEEQAFALPHVLLGLDPQHVPLHESCQVQNVLSKGTKSESFTVYIK